MRQSAGDSLTGLQKRGLRLIVLLGVVSLLADATYEGARSIVGPYLGALGASAAVVGVVAGMGELAGYGLRLVFGSLADRTRRYWLIAISGYVINLAAVPLLALAGRWESAALLVLLERAGKAVRAPARDAILSHAAAAVGRGWGFGLHEALDQIGAVLGPLLVAWVLKSGGSYSRAFVTLAAPALCALAVLGWARASYPNPRDLERRAPALETVGLPRVFWLYLGAAGLLAAGYADFALLAYHLERARLAPSDWIALLYAGAMGLDALAALAFGRWFDRAGIRVLALTSLIASPFAGLVVLGGRSAAVLGLALWGLGMGAQESVLRAAVASLAPAERRAAAYGLFQAGFGLSWFLGSAAMGLLYGISKPALAAFSLLTQLAAAWLFLLAAKQGPGGPKARHKT